jgi:hypothetical protein
VKTYAYDQRGGDALEVHAALSSLKLRYDRRRHGQGVRAHIPERRRIRPVTTPDRRGCERFALSFPLEYTVLPWSKYRILRKLHADSPSAERNPRGALAFDGQHPWHRTYFALARFFGELIFVNGSRCWKREGQAESAAGLDLSEGGLRMATSGPLWLGASVHLRIPSATLGCFAYTVLGRVVHLTCRDPGESQAGIAFTAIHPEDRHGLLRFLTSPLPQLAALRRREPTSA